MSGFAPYETAWDASAVSTRKVRAYIKQTLSSGMIKCAALGRFRPGFSGENDKDILAAVGSSLCLLKIDGPSMSISSVCRTPVFANVLSIISLRSPADAQTVPSSDSCHGEVGAVLAESGAIALVRVERFNDSGYRIRMTSESQAYMGLEDGSCLRMLRKLVGDPLSRVVCLVSWLDYIELVRLDWGGADSAAQQCPVSLGARLNIELGGVICDAAILAPSKSELQRVLLVAAVVDRQKSVYLHLYEYWACFSGPPTVALLAKLPLPFSMAKPVHIVPLPAFSESFLLITENEIAFINALQILSGDVHLHCRPLPQRADGGRDLVKSFCVAGTTTLLSTGATATPGAEGQSPKAATLPKSPLLDGWRTPLLSEARRSSEAISTCPVAQKIYLATQSGTLHLVCASARPFIYLATVDNTSSGAASGQVSANGDVMLFIGACGQQQNCATQKAATNLLVTDYLFASGDCVDHAVVRATTCLAGPANTFSDWGAGTGASNAAEAMTLELAVRPVLTNPSPTIDITLTPYMAYWTTGRSPAGSIHRAQFGHIVSIEELIEVGSNMSEARVATFRLWHFALSASATSSSNAPDLYLVLQRAQGALAISMDSVTREWLVSPTLQQLVAGKRVVYIGDVKPHSSLQTEWVLCISSNCVKVQRMSLLDPPASALPLTLATARNAEDFTHGACVVSLTGQRWAVLAVDSHNERNAANAQRLPQYRSSIRIVPIPDGNVMALNDPQGQQMVEFALEHEVSCLKAFTIGCNTYVAVGTYEPRLQIFCLVPTGAIAKLVPLAIDLPLTTADSLGESICMEMCSPEARVLDCPSQIVNDIFVLCNSMVSCILVGLRDGVLLQLVLDGSLAADTALGQSVQIANITRDAVGDVPVQFAAVAPTLASEEAQSAGASSTLKAMIFAGSLYVAEIGQTGHITTSICFGDVQPLNRILSMSPLIDTFGVSGPGNARRFVAVDDTLDAIMMLRIDFEPQCCVDELRIGCEPRRVICDPETGMILAAGVLPHSPTSPFPTSSLTVLDPRDGQIHAEVELRLFELVHALEAWYIHGSKSYRYLCVGTGMYPATSDGQGDATTRAKSGRLIIYSLKAAKRKQRTRASTPALLGQPNLNSEYELKYVWESEREGPVSALARLGDKYLVVAASTACLVLKLDVVQKRLIECCELTLRFPITSLHVRGNDIAAGCQREGAHVLRFTPAEDTSGYDALHMLHSVRFGVCTANACFVSDDLVLGVSNSGYLYALGIPSRSSEVALDYIMGIHLGTECRRVKQGGVVQRLRRPAHSLAWSGSAHESSSDGCLIVSSVDGTLWTLLCIEDGAYALLRQLELAMLSMGPSHAAYPLLVVDGSIGRARYTNSLPATGIVDGALSTVFVESLTEAEQRQVIQSSNELQRMALGLLAADNSWRSQCCIAPDDTQFAIESVAWLIRELNRACVC